MGVKEQLINDKYAIYNSDCLEVMPDIKDESIDMSIYSPPFASMYRYSGSDRDLGNNRNYEEFLQHYEYVIKEVHRVMKPGRISCVHCMDLPISSEKGIKDFSGDIIRLHEKNGFLYWDRKIVWKEPLMIAIRTRMRALMHCSLCRDTLKCRGVLPDYLLIFKKKGENETPVDKPYGLTSYDGDLDLMNEIEKREYLQLVENYVNYKDDKTNRLSQFIWRRYASSSWEDIRANVCLTYKPARDKEDDRHVCPLQIDIITRAVILYTNINEVVLDPFMGIGSAIYGAVIKGRKGIGIELKESYYNQAIKNLKDIKYIGEQKTLFDEVL